MPLPSAQVADILSILEGSDATLADLLIAVLTGSSVSTPALHAVIDPINLLDALETDPTTSEAVATWATAFTQNICRTELLALTHRDAGLHFAAKYASQDQLENFDISQLVEQYRTSAPVLWSLIQMLLDADAERLANRRKRYKRRRRKRREHEPVREETEREGSELGARLEDPMDVDDTGDESLIRGDHHADNTTGSDDRYWEDFEDLPPLLWEDADGDDDGLQWRANVGGRPSAEEAEDEDDDGEGEAGDEEEDEENGADGDTDAVDVADEEELVDRRAKIASLKAVVTMSVLMQNTNQRCNALQSTIGIYLHACRASESVIELLSRLGISISRSSIDSAVKSLWKESHVNIRKVGQSLLGSYVFDNFDVEVKHLVPTAEKPQDSLLHMTAGTIIPLDHDVTLDDLRCSDELWGKSKLNLANHSPSTRLDWKSLSKLHPDSPLPSSGLTRRQRFNQWKFLDDLVRHGPEYFRMFVSELDEPETVDQIPLVKSRQVPVEGMDINQSKADGNKDALEDLFRQGGVGDPQDSPGVKPIDDHVVIVHGDLSTCERVQSVLRSRSLERTPWRRFQHVIFCIGLFHLKMACADAIWKILISPTTAREDPTSLMAYVAEIRPKETGKVGSKPGFRRMHEVIRHVGIASRLDCWRVEVQKRHRLGSLEEWAARKPSWGEIESIAAHLACSCVADKHFSRMRSGPSEERDLQWENMLLREQYFLLYEELSYAMNAGDIGRVETCFMPWAFIFRACGKHKYAAQMMKFLHDVHIVYPPRLRRAIRMNILCNPTGRKHHFRAIDWWMEHNNFYTKRIYGGQFSNRTKKRILRQSALIGVYKSIRISFERMFALEHRTYRHAAPKMEKTLRKLRTYMEVNKAHIITPGRSTKHIVSNMINDGAYKMMEMTTEGDGDNLADGVAIEDEIDGDDGDLDV